MGFMYSSSSYGFEAAAPFIFFGLVFAGIIAMIVRSHAIASMKSAVQKTQANDYVEGGGLNITASSNNLINRSTQVMALQAAKPTGGMMVGGSTLGGMTVSHGKPTGTSGHTTHTTHTSSHGPSFQNLSSLSGESHKVGGGGGRVSSARPSSGMRPTGRPGGGKNFGGGPGRRTR